MKEFYEIISKKVDKLIEDGEIESDGILVYSNPEKVNLIMFSIFDADDLTIEGLRNLRNMYVEVIADRIEKERNNEKVDYDKIDCLHAVVCVVTGTLDKIIFEKGGEV